MTAASVSSGPQDFGIAHREQAPHHAFRDKLRQARTREPIELGAAAQLRLTSLGLEPVASLHARYLGDLGSATLDGITDREVGFPEVTSS
jgi:hypothetical protein